MSEIPDDIMEAAYRCVRDGNDDHGARATIIARALMAERERAATYVESDPKLQLYAFSIRRGDHWLCDRSDHTASMEAAAPGYGETRG